jgi:hypothetical protein
MRAYIDPRPLDPALLRFVATAPGRFSVRIGELIAGTITLTLHGHVERWHWALTGPHLPANLQPGSGEADTLAAARQALTDRFEAWRHWAQGSPAVWNTGA